MEHNISTLNKAVITIIAFLLSINFSLAQTLKGKVLDSKTGEPVIGATVATLDASQGVVTNYDGEFSIQVKKRSIGQIAGCDTLESLVNTGDSDKSKFSTAKSSFESPL